MKAGGPNNELVGGECEVASPSEFVSYKCARCGTTTKHLRDPIGVLHCRRGALEESVCRDSQSEDGDEVSEGASVPPQLPGPISSPMARA